jgi:8-hydroxy-5-deazaflavin:NADPH oxidoreductase
MKIGIVGSGNVGGTLGRRFAEAGHTVTFGTRRPDSAEMQELAKIPGASVATNAEAAQRSEIIVLATPWPATEDAIRGLGDLSGKILFDCVNPLKPKLDGLELGTTTSASESIAKWAPGARVVKIFNTIGYNIMADPSFPGGPATLFYCGDDAAAKKAAHDLAAQLGFDPIDAGPLTQARLLEPFALLWISLAFGGQGREIAFHLMKR